MKALTLTQPYATLVAAGAKRIETRSWATSYRGPIAIHAGMGLGPVGGKVGLQAICTDEPFRSVIKPIIYEEREHRGERYPTWDLMRLPRGAIVAVATLVDCRRTQLLDGVTVFQAGHEWRLTDQERAFGDYAPGRSAWLLADVRRLPEPVPCRGALGLWTVPPSIAEAVEAQL